MNYRYAIGITTLVTALTGAGVVVADSDEGGGWFFGRGKSRVDIRPVSSPLYTEECGSCHFAYQPGLLPARSWQAMMEGLEDHFGENAELDTATRNALTEYLVAHAADRDRFGRSRGIAGSIRPEETPLRVTETRYFRGKHDEVPLRLVEGNPKVGSFSRCAACHTSAAAGNYDEDEVRIPGVGRWED